VISAYDSGIANAVTEPKNQANHQIDHAFTVSPVLVAVAVRVARRSVGVNTWGV
jgi:hypothetical protein